MNLRQRVKALEDKVEILNGSTADKVAISNKIDRLNSLSTRLEILEHRLAAANLIIKDKEDNILSLQKAVQLIFDNFDLVYYHEEKEGLKIKK